LLQPCDDFVVAQAGGIAVLKSFASFLENLVKLRCSVGGATERKSDADQENAHEIPHREEVHG
jgi:hypothetical protein